MEKSSPPYWIYGFILLSVAFVALAWYIFNEKGKRQEKIDDLVTEEKQQPSSSSNYDPVVGWGESTPATGATCKGYQFPHSTTKDFEQNCLGAGRDGYNTFLQSHGRTLDKTELNGAELYNPLVSQDGKIIYREDRLSCLQSDTANIILMERTCDKVFKPLPDGLDFEDFRDDLVCTGQDGAKYKFGESEQFYSYCDSGGEPSAEPSPFCPGILGGVSVGFQFLEGTPTSFQETRQNETDFVPLIEVIDTSAFLSNGFTDISSPSSPPANDLAIPEQQFQIIRARVFSERPSDSNIEGRKGSEGIFAKIVHRASGKCLMPDNLFPNESSSLVIGDCDLNDGFIWALIPQLSYSQKDSTGSVYNDAVCEEGLNVLDSLGNPVVRSFKAAGPQQIVFVGNSIKPDLGINLNDPDSTAAYLRDPENNAYSLYMRLPHSNQGTIGFGPFQTLKVYYNDGVPTTACDLDDHSCFSAQCSSGINERPPTTNHTNYNSQISSMVLFNSVMAGCKKRIIPYS